MRPTRALLPALAFALVLLAISCGGGGGGDSGGDKPTKIPSGYPYPVQAIPLIQDRSHFPPGQVYTSYNSNPPTSGPHASAPSEWGISDLAIPKETLLHNMEHAGVVVWYNCNAGGSLSADACTTLRGQLSAVVGPQLGAGKRVVMSPYPDMPHRIAVTAWGLLDEFDKFDAQRVQLFIETFECKFDPEHFCK